MDNTDDGIALEIVSMNNNNMIKISNDPTTNAIGLQYAILSNIFTTTGLTIFIVYFIKQKYNDTSLITTEYDGHLYPFKVYNNKRILNGITKDSTIIIGNSDEDKYITLYTFSINLSSGSGSVSQWSEALYNKNPSKSNTITFQGASSFSYDNIGLLAFGGPTSLPNGTYSNSAFNGNIGEILVYNNFLDPVNLDNTTAYNQNVSYLRNKWNI